ncbi:hypothetical protein [Nonomuraea sp. NPDC050783]|uniref:hypothetical protein n=1 Tax=Nonomuraea sp. NPDC050783 TaxID=3154634 RepID=UPI003466DEEC
MTRRTISFSRADPTMAALGADAVTARAGLAGAVIVARAAVAGHPGRVTVVGPDGVGFGAP